MASYRNFGIPDFNKKPRLQVANAIAISPGSNSSEISKAMEKISEMNQLMAQHQIAQQRTLQALLYQQEQSSESQEASQRIQSQALRVLTDATKQRGFDAMFN